MIPTDEKMDLGQNHHVASLLKIPLPPSPQAVSNDVNMNHRANSSPVSMPEIPSPAITELMAPPPPIIKPINQHIKADPIVHHILTTIYRMDPDLVNISCQHVTTWLEVPSIITIKRMIKKKILLDADVFDWTNFEQRVRLGYITYENATIMSLEEWKHTHYFDVQRHYKALIQEKVDKNQCHKSVKIRKPPMSTTLAQKRAVKNGLSLHDFTPTGPMGHILSRDVIHKIEKHRDK